MIGRAKAWARNIKKDVVAIYIAGRDPRTPWLPKAIAIAVALYALSPIDLIPDFIPVIGYLDDLIIVPLGIMLVVRLIPTDLMAEFRQTAEERGRLPVHWAGTAFIIGIWIVGFLALGWWASGFFYIAPDQWPAISEVSPLALQPDIYQSSNTTGYTSSNTSASLSWLALLIMPTRNSTLAVTPMTGQTA